MIKLKVVWHYATIASTEMFHDEREIGQHKFQFRRHTQKVVSKQRFAKMKQWNIILLVIDWTKSMHTESQHICLVGTETTKVPALDLYKNSKSKNKNLPFF